MPLALLATKLYIPHFRPGLVQRLRLLQKLDESLKFDRKLTLVSAPAGFGKTTLVLEWLNSLTSHAESPKICWLSLDSGDNELAIFLTYLIGALQTCDPALGKTTRAMLDSDPLPPPGELIPPLINDLSGISYPLILVLDDYHTIQTLAIHEALTFLLERQPPRFHLVITTRQDPLLPLARFRGRGQLTEIRLSDLRFTEPEAASFLNQMMGLDLSPADIAALETRTEGWIAGLQLAAVSLQQSASTEDERSRSNFIQAFAGDDRYIMDYLIDEVLSRQSEDTQKFLLMTSILERFDDDLCAAVIHLDANIQGAASSRQTLDYLDQSNLFLIHLDNRREWYRYHHLFADLLQQRLAQEYGASFAAELHRRAARCFATKHLVGEAVAHAASAKDFEWLADYLEGVLQTPAAWSGGEANRLLRWLEILPARIVETRPMLSIHISRVLYLNGNFKRGLAMQKKVEDFVQKLPESPEKDHLRGRIASNMAMIEMTHERFETQIVYTRQALELLDKNDELWQSRTLYAMALGLEETGHIRESHQAFEKAVEYAEMIGSTFSILNSRCSLAFIMIRQGQLRAAEQVCRAGLAAGSVKESEGAPAHLTPAASLVTLVKADIHFERGELAEAEKTILETIALADQGGILTTLNPEVWLPILFWSRLGLRNREGAYAAARQFDDTILLPSTSEHQHLSFEAMRAGMALGLGDVSQASAWARRYEQSGPATQKFVLENPGLYLARVYLAENRLPEALTLADRLAEQAENIGMLLQLIELQLLRAVVLDRLDRPVDSQAALRRALELAVPEGFKRPFIFQGPGLTAPLEAIKKATTEQSTLDFIAEILASQIYQVEPPAEKPQPSKIVSPNQSLVEPLTERELEVLAMVAEGLTNPEIAAKLYLSPNTLKAHTQNIYSKLDVHSRVQLVNKARELGLIE